MPSKKINCKIIIRTGPYSFINAPVVKCSGAKRNRHASV